MRDVEATVTVPEGSRWAFVSLYERTVTDVYSYLVSRVGDRETADYRHFFREWYPLANPRPGWWQRGSKGCRSQSLMQPTWRTRPQARWHMTSRPASQRGSWGLPA